MESWVPNSAHQDWDVIAPVLDDKDEGPVHEDILVHTKVSAEEGELHPCGSGSLCPL